MNAAGRHAFAPPHVRQRSESAPARGAAPVHLVARAGEHRARDDGLVVLAVLRTGSGSGHITPSGFPQAARRFQVSTRVQSVGYRRRVFLAQLRFSHVNSCVPCELQPSPCRRSNSPTNARTGQRDQGGPCRRLRTHLETRVPCRRRSPSSARSGVLKTPGRAINTSGLP